MTFAPVVVSLVLNETETVPAFDYEKAFRAARRKAAGMSLATRRKLAEVYYRAASEAGAIVRDSLERGLSKLTVERWSVMARNLKAAADSVARGVEDEGKALISSAAPLFPELEADFVWSAAKIARATTKITRKGLGRIVASINMRVIESFTTRAWSDGYTFSERVWGGIRSGWLEDVKMTVAAGIAQGRDPAKIARDIQIYTADGKVALAKRWGALERGTSEFAKRLPKEIDYRALRLVRTELYTSLQDASIRAGEANPACTGLFDWVLTIGRQHWGCGCEDLAAEGPYKADEVPTIPHPNCSCSVRPRLMDTADFVADLKKWMKGESVPYLDSWDEKTFKGSA